MRIAIVGTGISGLICAYLLQGDHELTIYEANDYVGGHTNTVDVPAGDREWAVDTGFIVFNNWTYPNFIRLLDRLGVGSQASEMSFSARDESRDFEYNGASLNALFAQRSNAFSPRFWRMLRDISRFNKDAKALIKDSTSELTLGEFVERNAYSRAFTELYLRPIGAAIWSADPARFFEISALYAAQFFENHGMLSVNNRPQWRTVKGGSREYVRRIVATLHEPIRLSTPVRAIRRHTDRVEVESKDGIESFDNIIIAAHSDQALRMLGDPTEQEREILGAIAYQANETVLHTDQRVMPKRRRAWAAWNYHLHEQERGKASLTYNMNILQTLDASEQFCVTLNKTADLAADRILRRFEYHHPIYTRGTVAAQTRWAEINGPHRTWFCGAYWGFGFHEDGLKSGLRVCEKFGKSL
ncbi:MAG: FAD-dependent oxidoreductase [Candidatus Sumerlaeota bacterium]